MHTMPRMMRTSEDRRWFDWLRRETALPASHLPLIGISAIASSSGPSFSWLSLARHNWSREKHSEAMFTGNAIGRRNGDRSADRQDCADQAPRIFC